MYVYPCYRHTAASVRMDMDQVCPRCKTTKYRNPNTKLMVNVCGHNICETCVELLFAKVVSLKYFFVALIFFLFVSKQLHISGKWLLS